MTSNKGVTMQRVLVACVAGASSTFLARRLTELSQSSDADIRFVPTPIDSLGQPTDIVALSSHVATPAVRDQLVSTGTRFVVLPENVRGAFGAEDAFSAITAFIREDGGNLGSLAEATSSKGQL
jgi:galactitol-specific phosphotransferase system IIB component